MAPWLKYFLKLAKSLLYGYCGLVNLYTTEYITHILFTVLPSENRGKQLAITGNQDFYSIYKKNK